MPDTALELWAVLQTRGNEVMTQKETDKSLRQIMMFLLEVSDVNLFIARPGR